MIKTVTGDATSPRPGSRGVIIAHITNNLGLWGSGFVKAVSKMSRVPELAYAGLASDHGFSPTTYPSSPTTYAQIPLGIIQFVEAMPNVWVANMVAQNGTNSFDSKGTRRQQKVNVDGGNRENLVDYAALERCLAIVFHRAVALKCDVHMPNLMGSGLAGGDKAKIHEIIKRAYDGQVLNLDNIFDVTLWEFVDTSAASFIPPTPVATVVDDDVIDSQFSE